MHKSDELKQKRAKVAAECRKLTDAARAENRDLTADETRAFDEHMAEIEKLNPEIKRQEQMLELEYLSAGVTPPPSGFRPGLDLADDSPGYPPSTRDRAGDGGELRCVDSHGRELRLIGRGRRLADLPSKDGERRRLSVGKMIVGKVTGRWHDAELEQRAMSGASDSAGGWTVDATELIDLARNQGRIFQAGAYSFEMDQPEMKVAKVASDPSMTWRHENQNLTESEPTFTALNFRARTVGTYVKMSLELAQDSPNAAQLLEEQLAMALALEIDRVALRGEGAAAEPLGISGSGVNTLASIGAISGYDKFSEAVESIWEGNGNPNAVLIPTALAGAMDRFKDGEGQPLTPPKSYTDMRQLVTNQLRSTLGVGSDESEAVVGDFRNLWVGFRAQADVEASRQAAQGSSSAFTALQVWVRIFARLDVGVVRPTHFTYMSGMTF